MTKAEMESDHARRKRVPAQERRPAEETNRPRETLERSADRERQSARTLASVGRVKDALRRWMSVVLAGLVGGTLCATFAPWLSRLGAPVAEGIAEIPPLALLILAAALIGPIAVRCAWRRWLAWPGLKHFFSYPPLWLAVVLGFCLVRCWNPRLGKGPGMAEVGEVALWFLNETWALMLAMAGAVTLVVIVDRLLARPIKNYAGAPVDWNDFNSIRAWLACDTEICAPGQDCLDRTAIVARIARRLRRLGGTAPASIAVVGPLGSGKSSLGSLVQHELAGCRGIRFVRVSVWPYESPEAAARGIIQKLCQAAALEVNVLEQTELPQKYTSAVEQAGGWWAAIARWLAPVTDPQTVLAQFNRIATAIGCDFVLWVEDLERLAGAHDGLEPEESARLSPLRALLYELDRQPRIHVIVAGTSLDVRFDLDKIARYIEHVPALAEDQVRRAVMCVRAACLTGHPVRVIDPADPAWRNELYAESDGGARQLLENAGVLAGPREPTTASALAGVLQTPRALKSALRLALETWEQLPGEVDLDDTIMMSAIRIAHPNIYAAIDEQFENMRVGFARRNADPKENPAYQRLESLLEQIEPQAHAEAVRFLIQSVFPAYPCGHGDDFALERPQGFAALREYWTRYSTAAEVPPGDRDQEALAAIISWRGGDKHKLLAHIATSAFEARVERFVRLFEPAELCNLLRQVCAEVRPSATGVWSEPHAPGIARLCRMMYRRQVPADLVSGCLMQLLEEYIPVQLPIVWSLCYLLASPTPRSLRPLVDDAQRASLKRHVQNQITKAFPRGSWQKLRSALRDGQEQVLKRLFNYACEGDQACFAAWSDFMAVLTDFAEAAPYEAIPYILPFFVTADNVTERVDGELRHVARFHFDAGARGAPFPPEIIRVLATTPVPPSSRDDLKQAWEAAQQGAADALRSSPKPHLTVSVPTCRTATSTGDSGCRKLQA